MKKGEYTHHPLSRLRAFVDHWITQLVVGFILLVSVGFALIDDEIHHGIGVWAVMITLPSVLQGLERVLRHVKKVNRRRRRDKELWRHRNP